MKVYKDNLGGFDFESLSPVSKKSTAEMDIQRNKIDGKEYLHFGGENVHIFKVNGLFSLIGYLFNKYVRKSSWTEVILNKSEDLKGKKVKVLVEHKDIEEKKGLINLFSERLPLSFIGTKYDPTDKFANLGNDESDNEYEQQTIRVSVKVTTEMDE